MPSIASVDPFRLRHGELLAKRLMRHAGYAVAAAWENDEFHKGNARQAGTLIDAALYAATLTDVDPRIVQMELAGYFASGRCELGVHGEQYLDDVAEADVLGMTFIDQLSEAARRDGLEEPRA